jgi:hypothetical protein
VGIANKKNDEEKYELESHGFGVLIYFFQIVF